MDGGGEGGSNFHALFIRNKLPRRQVKPKKGAHVLLRDGHEHAVLVGTGL